MSGFKINIKGFEEVKNNLKNLDKRVMAEVQKELYAFGLQTVSDAKQRAPVNEGHLRNSISFVKRPMAVDIVVAADYAAYVEFGTRKFAAAHVASLPQDWQKFAAKFKGGGRGSFDDFVIRLVEWVKKKGLHATTGITNAHGERQYIKTRKSKSQKDEDADKVAYAIALSIMKNGIRPHPFLFPAVELNKIKLIERLKTMTSGR